jgi:hypothetical protein
MAPGYNMKNGFNGGAQNDIFALNPAWNGVSGTWSCECSWVNIESHVKRNRRSTQAL